MPSEFAILSNNPGLVTIAAIAFVVGYILKIASQASESVAKLLGGLGRRWREQDQQAVRRVSRQRRQQDAVAEDLRRELAHFVGRVDRLDSQVDHLQRRADLHDDYLAYDAGWHARFDRHAAREGWVIPPPPHMTFSEVVADRQARAAPAP